MLLHLPGHGEGNRDKQGSGLTGPAQGIAGPAHAQDRQNPNLEREEGMQSRPIAAGGGSFFKGLTASGLTSLQWMRTQPKINEQHKLDLMGLRKLKRTQSWVRTQVGVRLGEVESF